MGAAGRETGSPRGGERRLHTDICIVGGGPAGLVLALLLLRSGVRVTVLERRGSQSRAFRGEIVQPGALSLLDELGVLAGARSRGAHELDRFRVVEHGRVLLDIDYRSLPSPHNHLLSLPQAHLLDELLLRCRAFTDFRYLDGNRATALLRDGRAVVGVTATGPEGPCSVLAHTVVGADGRYSKIRRLAGISAGRNDLFDQDVLWFRLDRSARDTPGSPAAPAAPTAPARTRDVRVFRASGNPVLVYDSWPDQVQLGWTLPHQGYREAMAGGLDEVKRRLALAAPPYAELIMDQIGSLRQLALLDVFSARAERWSDDGLVLIGDAAHTHSPIGAQGLNLAVQDAVLLHPLLVSSLATANAGAAFLSRFERHRGPDIDAVLRMQRMQSKALLSTGGLANRVRPHLAAALRRTPVFRKVLRRIAYGNPAIRLAHECFV